MCSIIQDKYPDLLEAFYQAGARRVDFAEMLPPELKAQYRPAAIDEKLWVLLCRRATMETVLRRHVESLPHINIVNNCKVTGMLTHSSAAGDLTATGIAVEREGVSSSRPADIVVDASGRKSKFPIWFAALGRDLVEENADAEIVYYTKHYRLQAGRSEPSRGERAGAGDLGYLKYGVFPGDNGHFSIILCLPLAEKLLLQVVRDSAQFDEICRNIPGLAAWLDDNRSSATTEPFGMADIRSVWRHYLPNDEPLARNFFAVGDAALRTNPLYGRGCSIGILHAHILVEVIAADDDPLVRARHFEARTENELRPIYTASLREDKSGIQRSAAILEGHTIDKPDNLKKWFRGAFADAFRAASREQLHVMRGAMKTFHLLEKPGDFLKEPKIRWTVLRYMLRGRRRNSAKRLQPGPDRQQMHQLLGIPGQRSKLIQK
jgi:2-polyprenyl-6-methoxyphenol hydroxylase-like FAD-dependent oxidoreductase